MRARRMSRAAALCLAAVVAAAAPSALGGAYEDAAALERRAQKLLGEAIGSAELGSEKCKEALELLEKARGLLEEFAFEPAAAKERELIEKINSLIYWTKKSSPIQVERPAPPDPLAGEEAKKFWDELLAYERKHTDEPVRLVARFFEASELLRGTDWAEAAMLKARLYQDAAARVTAAREKERTELEKLAAKGDEYLAAGNAEEAAAAYAEEIEKKPMAGLAKRLGFAYFRCGSDLRAEYTRVYCEAQEEYSGAFFSSDRETMKKALIKVKDAKAIAVRALAFYSKSRDAYRRALELSPKGKDLEADVYVALTFAVDPKPESRRKAIAELERIVAGYDPATVRDRMIYEHAKGELDSLKSRREE